MDEVLIARSERRRGAVSQTLKSRRIEPEILDQLSAQDPRAVQSRRDLRKLNWFMGHSAILRRELLPLWPMPRPVIIAELGCGDCALLARTLRQFPAPHPDSRLTLLDAQQVASPETLEQFKRSGWNVEVKTGDARAWFNNLAEDVDCIVANLFLHHFEDAALHVWFRQASLRAGQFIALEPFRSRMALAATRLIGLIGCNDVTRNDARVSVRAGFRGGELSALWPAGTGWRIDERRKGLFTHYFVARRE